MGNTYRSSISHGDSEPVSASEKPGRTAGVELLSIVHQQNPTMPVGPEHRFYQQSKFD